MHLGNDRRSVDFAPNYILANEGRGGAAPFAWRGLEEG